MFDLIVRNAKAIAADWTGPCDVAVQGDKIASIEPPGVIQDHGHREIDAAGRLLFPGGVDVHCHYNLDNWGRFRTEGQDFSIAAAFGGTTTIIDFAVQDPGQTLGAAIAAKRQEADGRTAVDYGLHVILTGDPSFETIEEIGDVINAGVPTIKTVTTYGWMCDDGHRWGVMTEVAKHGGMSLIHAEDDAIARWLTKKAVREGRVNGAYISETRNSLVEEAAIRRVMLLAERSGGALYVLHMAAGAGVEALAEGRAKGLPFYGETLTPYLSFTSEDLWDERSVRVGEREYPQRGLLLNNFPTIKSRADRDVLWTALADDRLQVVSSDHAAINVRNRYEKQGTTVEAMQAGQAGVELRLPVLFHLGVAAGKLSLQRFVQLVATNPARLMGLYPAKGALAVGSDADLVIFDPDQTWTVAVDKLHMSVEYNCWEGWEVRGKVVTTILRGSVLLEDGTLRGPTNRGKYLPRRLDREVVEGRA